MFLMKYLSFFAAITAFLFNHRITLVNGREKECDQNLIDALKDSNTFNAFLLGSKAVVGRMSLFLKVDPDNNIFSGRVTIEAELNPGDADHPKVLDKYLVLYADPSLKIEKVRIRQGKNDLKIGEQCRCSELGFWLVELKFEQQKTQYTFEVAFSGSMGSYDQFYKFDFGEVDGVNRCIAGNVCGPSKVFPFLLVRKTFFDIVVEHPASYNALSSYSLFGSEQNGAWITSRFEASKMPLPLTQIGITVHNYFTDSHETNNGTEFRVWSDPEYEEARQYSIDFATKVLQFHQRYTRMPCPFQKLDFVALRDFLPNAMAMGALVNVEEAVVLWKAGESAIEQKIRIAFTIAHELAHVWFGARVSSKFNHDRWLEEAFADWMKYKAVDGIESWRYGDEQLLNIKRAYDADSLDTPDAEAVVQNGSSQIIGSYPILYCKGAAIVSMMERHVGEDAFRKAVRLFLKDFDGKLVVYKDFLNKLQESGNSNTLQKMLKGNKPNEDVDIPSIYENWLTKPGFPFVKVSRVQGRVRLTQGRFLKDGQPTDKTLWHIPIRYYLNDTVFPLILLKDQQMVVDRIGPNDLFKFNVDYQGFYITWYDDWNQLISQLPRLTPRDTAGLLLDINFLTLSEKVEYRAVAGLIGQILNSSSSVITWDIGQNLTKTVYHFMKMQWLYRQDFAKLVKSWLLGKYNREMWSEAGKTEQQIRYAALIIELACYFGAEQCLADAKSEFDTFISNNTLDENTEEERRFVIWPHPDVRSALFCYGLKKTDDPEDLSFMWDLYTRSGNTATMQLKEELAKALGFVRYPGWVDWCFQSLRQEYEAQAINVEDLNIFLRSVADNTDVLEQAWNSFQTHILPLDTIEPEVRAKMVLIFANHFSDPNKRIQIDEILSNHLPDMSSTYQPQVDRAIEENDRWLMKCMNGFFPEGEE